MSTENKKLLRILSIDGGGIRGILPGQILVSLEQKLKERTKDPDARLAQYFDLIAGTSTGGILACLYLTPDVHDKPAFSAKEALDIYLKHGNEIFNIPFWHKIRSLFGLTDEKYPTDRMEELMKEKVGDTKLSEIVSSSNCLITSFNVSEGVTSFFTSLDAKRTGKDYYLRDVARATSAAPTYFQAALVGSVNEEEDRKKDYGMLDGGVFANNPTMCALVEGYKMLTKDYIACGKVGDAPSATDIFVLSIGTTNRDTKDKRPRFPYHKVKNFGAIQWIIPIIDIMMTGVSETVAYQVEQLYKLIGCPDQYIRLNPEILHADGAMDNASKKNLKLLEFDGIEAAEKFDEELELTVTKLLQGRQT